MIGRRLTRNRHGAEGAVYRRLVQAVISRDYGVCWICHHPGAQSADHVIPVTERPDLARDPSNMKAVHGYDKTRTGCPVCSAASIARGGKPVFCNEVRQAGSAERARRILEQRTGLVLTRTEDKPRGERDWDGF